MTAVPTTISAAPPGQPRWTASAVPSLGVTANPVAATVAAAVTFGVLPAVVWPWRWATLLDRDRPYYRDLAVWWQRRVAPVDAKQLDAVLNDLRPRPILMVLPWLAVAFAALAVGGYAANYDEVWRHLVEVTFGRHQQPFHFRPPPLPGGERTHAVWEWSLGLRLRLPVVRRAEPRPGRRPAGPLDEQGGPRQRPGPRPQRGRPARARAHLGGGRRRPVLRPRLVGDPDGPGRRGPTPLTRWPARRGCSRHSPPRPGRRSRSAAATPGPSGSAQRPTAANGCRRQPSSALGAARPPCRCPPASTSELDPMRTMYIILSWNRLGVVHPRRPGRRRPAAPPAAAGAAGAADPRVPDRSGRHGGRGRP